MRTWLFSFVMFLLAAGGAIANDHVLWEIGKPDGDDAEFALAPNSYQQFGEDAFYLVGYSTPKHDWPYVHPGPFDSWAGGRAHTFTIVFGVRRTVASGDCRLVLDLVDTQSKSPPSLVIEVNGRAFEHRLPPGAGDSSLKGQPEKGKPRHVAVTFPAALLKPGDNQITIANVSGSWLLYDRVALECPIEIEAALPANHVRISSIQTKQALVEREAQFYQPLDVSLGYAGEPLDASLTYGQTSIARVRLHGGVQRVAALIPEVKQETGAEVALVADGKTLASRTVTIEPVRRFTVDILMHSHNDIGYTDIQPHIADKQAHNVLRALELIRQTKDYPVGARFKWNLEVLMPYEDFRQIATPEQEQEFRQAVHNGDIGIDAMYANLLTGVCRSEELLRQFAFAVALGRRCGVNVDSMMISDVPGLTWGIVPALAQNGVKYISAGPNAMPANLEGDRIGYVREAWEYKPFYWLSPSGREKVLYWAAPGGYSIGHGHRSVIDGVSAILDRLVRAGYPYDIVQLRWSKGDNGRPDEGVMDAVREWNAKYVYPRLVVATTSEAFHEFEKRYGAELPTYRGDLTPYWEDGTGSAARETALNRHSADRLLEAEALWAMLRPGRFPAEDFAAAWKNVALWSEHTWGAHNSVSDPDLPFVKTQWQIKQTFAKDADRQSRALLGEALGTARLGAPAAWDVFNTSSWARTDLVTLPKKTQGSGVKDEQGHPVPSQRLSTGELVFLARDVPPFGAKRFVVDASASSAGNAQAHGPTVKTSALAVTLDEATGAIVSLRSSGLSAELAAGPINNFIHLPGADVKDARPSGSAKLTVREVGPLVASLVAESAAPGCEKLIREVRLVDGLDRVEIIDSVNKKPVREVEGVHFGFAFNVPGPEVRINSPGAIVQPEKDQLPGACKNWFSVERWVDVSNKDYGVTWVTADAPLVEIGGLTANLPRQQPNPDAYLKTIEPSATLYSWVMNNHWHTNYRADQEGWVTFHYAIYPHGTYDAVAATRAGIESTQPLIAAPAGGDRPVASRIRIEPADVVATALKPSDDGKAVIVRLYGVSGKDEHATVSWAEPAPKSVWLSNAGEQSLQPAGAAVEVPAFGIVTLRAEMP